MQHRTVWVVGLAVLCAVGLKRGMRTGRPLLLVSSLLALGAAALIIAESNAENVLFRSIDSSVAETSTRNSTLAWRYEGWRLLLQDWNNSSSATDIALGWSFGASLRRYVDGVWDDTSAHDFYVDTTLRTGICGLIALFILYGGIGTRAFRERRDWRFVFWLLWISQILYYITYPPTFDQGILLGYLIGMEVRRRPATLIHISRAVRSEIHATESAS
jgi:O-antigen ligase